MLDIGAHLSTAGGCDLSIGRATDLSISALQIFTKQPNQWKAKPLDPAVIDRFITNREGSDLKHVVAHDSYLINVASPDDAAWEKSRLALIEELDRCDQLGIPFLVSHPGGHVGSGVDAGIARVAAAINRIHDDRPDGRCVLPLETTAGQGTTLGRSFDEIAAIIDGVANKERVAVCFDTCHVFAAGYDIRDQATYEETFRQFDQIIGLSYLKVFHLNDSKKDLGSRVDRHAHIGEGMIGSEAFRLLMSDPRFDGLPGLLETEHGDDCVEVKADLEKLRSLVSVAPVG